MKKFGIGVIVLLVLLLGGALVVPGFINWNEYKSQIELTASKLSDRDVVINGNISLSILPSPSFSAKDVSVSNVEDGQAKNFISLKSVDVNVAFFPLLRWQIKVKKFILVEPIVAIEIDKNGRGNWEFGTGQTNTDDQNSSTELSFEQFQIENGQISFQNLATDQLELVRMINASVIIDSLQGPFEVKGKARYKNLPLSMDLVLGTIRQGRKIPIKLDLGLIDDDVRIKFSGGLMLDENNPQATGKINLETDDMSDLILAMSLLDLKDTNQNNIAYNQPLSLESDMSYSNDNIAISALEFELGESRGSGQLTAQLGDKIIFDGQLSINSFNLDNYLAPLKQKDTSADNSNFNLEFLKNIEGKFNFKLGALRFNDKIASQFDLDLKVYDSSIELSKARLNMPGGSEFSANGLIGQVGDTPEFNGNVIINSGNLRPFLNWLKIDTSSIPDGRLTRLSYKGGLKANPDLLQFYEIDGALDTFNFKGGLSYALQQRPAFGVDMTFSNLNIDNYKKASADQPLNLKDQMAILADFDANYKLTLRNVTFEGIKVKSINLAGDLFDGNLNGRTVKIDNYAGFDLSGSVVARTLGTDPDFDITMNATATTMVPLQRAYRFKTTFDIAQVGAVSVLAKIKGDLEKLNIDIKSTFGSSQADVKGDIRSADLKQLPEIGSIDLVISASNPSLASLIDQFDLELSRASALDDRMIAINTIFKGTQKLLDVDGVVSVAGGEVSLKGRSSIVENKINSFDLSSEISGPDALKFIRGLGFDFNPSKKNLGPLQLKMAISGNQQDMVFKNIDGNIGPTKLTGSGMISGLSGQGKSTLKPDFDFTISLDKIEAHDFMQDTEKVENDWGNWSKQPMELEFLDDYNGRMLFTAQSMNYNEYHFENPHFEAILKDGVININNFTGKLFDGAVAMNGSFSSAGALEADMSLKKVSAALATKAAAGIAPINGYFDMTQKLKAKGISQNALISSLSGSGQIIAAPGLINGVNIPELSEKLKVLDNKNALLGLLKSSLSGGQTPYQGGQSTITAKNGIFQFSPLDLKMAGAKSAVNMEINLGQWQMDLMGDMTLLDHPDAPPIGISIVGALNSPSIKYNTKKLESFIGAKIASKLLQNMIKGNGGLGSLFGKEQSPEQTPIQDPNQSQEQSIPPAQDQSVEQTPIPETVPEKTPETIEDLGVKLLEKLFQQPPPPPN